MTAFVEADSWNKQSSELEKNASALQYLMQM